MSTTVVGARMSKRELAIIAVVSRIPDATPAEITRYAYRLFLGDSHEQARGHVLERRNSPLDSPTDVQEKITVRLPEDMVKAAREKTSDMNAATAHRYILALATTDDEQEARELASRKRGRPRKS